MRTFAVGDEIQMSSLRRIERRIYRFHARATDRRRWKLGIEIDVIRTRSIEVLAGQVAVKILETIDHRRISLKRHSDPKTIVKYGGDLWPLLRVARFLLDYGRERQHLRERHAEL